MSLPSDTPTWGGGRKKAIGNWFGRSMTIASHGSVMSGRVNHLDLDPTRRDPHGRPLMRMTFNRQDNELRMKQFMKTRGEGIARTMKPDRIDSAFTGLGADAGLRRAAR